MNVELNLSLPFEQLYDIVHSLPFQEKTKLKELLIRDTEKENNQNANTALELDAFKKLLLNGPVMSKEQYDNYKQIHKSFDQWAEKLFA
jgi:hypothetical protein